jgi:hypothetical protein
MKQPRFVEVETEILHDLICYVTVYLIAHLSFSFHVRICNISKRNSSAMRESNRRVVMLHFATCEFSWNHLLS